MNLIDDDIVQIFKQSLPLSVISQDGKVNHLRVGQQDIRWILPNFLSKPGGSITVINAGGQRARLTPSGQSLKTPVLVLGQGL